MARAKITDPSLDPITDAGSVLFSFVKGEQIEYPVDLNFYNDAAQLTLRAVVVEAQNVANQDSPPGNVLAGGKTTVLTTRVPPNMGNWSGTTNYSRGDLVAYQGGYYELYQGAQYQSTTPPTSLPNLWRPTTLQRIYVRFPSALGSDWAQKPSTANHVYGFFELRCSETLGAYQQTWKPVRGMVELQFSPTDGVT